MATREIATDLKLTGEKSFNDSMKAVNSNMKTLKSEMGAVTSEFGKNDASMSQSIRVSKNLKAQNEQQMEVIRAATIALKQNEEVYGKDSKQADKFRQIIASAQTTINKNNEELKKHNVALKTMQVVGKGAEATMKGVGKTIGAVGSAAGATAKGIGTITTAAVAGAAAVSALGVAVLGTMASYAKEAAEAAKAAQEAGEDLTENQQKWLEFSDSLGSLDAAVQGAKNALGGVLMPMLGELSTVGAQFLADFTADMEAAAGDTEKQGHVMAEYVSRGATLIKEQLPEFIETGKELFGALLEGLAADAPELMDTGLDLVMDILDGIIEAAPAIGDGAIELITKFMEMLIERGPDLVQSAAELVTQLVQGLAQAAPTLIPMAAELIVTLVTALIDAAPDLLLAGLELILGLVDGIKSGIGTLISSAGDLIDAFKEAFGDRIDDFLDIGTQIVNGIWEGLSGAWDWLMEQAGNLFGGLIDSVCDLLGIQSPSTVWADRVGKNSARGVGVGFEEEMRNVNKQIQASLNTSFDIPTPGGNTGPGRNYTVVGNGSGGNRTVNLYITAKQLTQADIQMIVRTVNEELGEAI